MPRMMEQSGDVPKIVFPDTVGQRTFEQFADMPALQAVEHSATTAAGVVGKTVAKSVVEARSQGLQSTVPKRSPQQSRSLLVLEFFCVKVSAACKEGRKLKERRSESGRLI